MILDLMEKWRTEYCWLRMPTTTQVIVGSFINPVVLYFGLTIVKAQDTIIPFTWGKTKLCITGGIVRLNTSS